MKKVFLLPVSLGLALTLSGCSLLSSLGSVLATPFSLLNGMANAIGRTVTDTETPANKPLADPAAERGAEIAARGTFRGGVGIEKIGTAPAMATR